MMFEFSPFYLVLWGFLGFFAPGALLSVALLKKRELPLFDKVLIGFGLGITIPALLAMLLFILGISFSYAIAAFCVGILYLAALLLFVKEKAWEGITIPTNYKSLAASAVLALILLLAFWVRMQSYGPVFMELDPYFYLLHASFILSEGGGTLNDGLAWYPHHEMHHRAAPMKSYLDALTYALYNHSAEYDRYLLSAVGGMLPPILAMLSVFFLYLFVSSEYKRMFGIAAAGVAAFMPMFLMKTIAGVSEIQPYAFFGIAFFLAMYALAIKKKDLLFAVLAGLAFFATTLGSSSAIVLTGALLIFIPVQAIFLFIIKEDLLKNVQINGIVLLLGPILAAVLNSLFMENFSIGVMFSGYNAILLAAYGFSLVMLLLEMMAGASAFKLPALQERLPKLDMGDIKKAAAPLGAIAILAILIVAFTPIGDPVMSMAKSTLGITQFNIPLDRTIAEQGEAGASFQNELGFIAMDFTRLPTLDQMVANFSSKNIVFALFDLVIGILQHLFAFLATFLTIISNLAISLIILVLNGIFGTGLQYTDKNNSMLTVVFFAMFAAIFHSLYVKFKTREQRIAILFAAFILPISIVGLFKTKYAIYLGFAIAAGLGIALGEAFDFISRMLGKMKDEEKKKKYTSYMMIGFTLICFSFVYFEWSKGIAEPLFLSSFQERFQDNPEALQPKMEKLCTISGYAPACSAAEDPIGFASKGTTSQYDQVLCIYSLFADPANPAPHEQTAVQLRCNMLAPYWIEFTEWQFEKSPKDARFTSWWDYGHWTNYFGERKTVLRNDHANGTMIMNIAHGFIDGTPGELIEAMGEYGSEYVFFDREIIYNADGSFGGKFHALNYLSCARDQETSVAQAPGQSICEAQHRWEQVAVPAMQQPCVISQLSGKAGVVAFDAATGIPKYCLGETTLLTGETIPAAYRMDEKYENGDLKLHKAFLKQIYTTQDGTRVFDAYYTKDQVWLEDGQMKAGWEDRTTKFYDSNLYKAFVLESLEGFTQVFKTSDNAVKLYKISG